MVVTIVTVMTVVRVSILYSSDSCDNSDNSDSSDSSDQNSFIYQRTFFYTKQSPKKCSQKKLYHYTPFVTNQLFSTKKNCIPKRIFQKKFNKKYFITNKTFFF